MNPPLPKDRRRIYLMRHGRVDYFSEEVIKAGDHRIARLTTEGREQASAAGIALSGVHFDVAICSGLRRTRETAQLAMAQFQRAPVLEEILAFEELRGGTLKFETRAEAAAAMAAQFQRSHLPGARMFAGERFMDAQSRAVSALESLVLERDWRTCLIVAHEGINRLILSWIAGCGLSAAPAFDQDTGCINVVDVDVATDELGAPAIARTYLRSTNLTPYNWIKHGMARTSLEAIFVHDES
jgi:phosphoserine phosphatase